MHSTHKNQPNTVGDPFLSPDYKPQDRRKNTMSSLASSFSSPMVVYPHSIKAGPSSHSRGSFGPVFIVLAVITILSAVACFLGRVLARRYFRPRTKSDNGFHAGDVEGGGHEMRISPPMKTQVNGGAKPEVKPADVGGTKVAKPTANGVERGA